MMMLLIGADGLTEEQQRAIAACSDRVRAMLEENVKDLDEQEQRIVRAIINMRQARECPSYDGKVQQAFAVISELLETLGDIRQGRKEVWVARADGIDKAMRVFEAELQKELRGDTSIH